MKKRLFLSVITFSVCAFYFSSDNLFQAERSTRVRSPRVSPVQAESLALNKVVSASSGIEQQASPGRV